VDLEEPKFRNDCAGEAASMLPTDRLTEIALLPGVRKSLHLCSPKVVSAQFKLHTFYNLCLK
jgi:hypothetical protein